ncbi:hypothetical protein AB833_20850 [Chromatiales bacterium (ex Bugula neritina AB1)]|nr:hypothetical protein AB833_20850 [Chromatiales bacterium (ex Bugula neritina AB1)]
MVSWHSLYVAGTDALLAPVLKTWLFLKPLLIKSLPAVLLGLWAHTGAKLISWAGEFTTLLLTLLGGWKAWSGKKLLRHAGRFLLSLSARFVIVSVLLNLLFGHERRGIKLLPRFAMHRLKRSSFGNAVRWWKKSSERRKRLLLGAALCLIFILIGQSMLGVSILLFDLIWELILILWLLLIRLWRFIGPTLLKLIPNFIGNFVTNTLIPLAADIVPIIKDDHRVIYLRFNVRLHLRRAKAWLYLKSRSRRHVVRKNIKPLVGEALRARKSALLSAAAGIGNGNKRSDSESK